MKKTLLLLISHSLVAFIGFAAGIYALPIIMAPDPVSNATIENIAGQANYTATFHRDLQDSDFLHWGEGEVSITNKQVTLLGELAPGPAYKLYFSPEFVETEADFKRLKDKMAVAGDIRVFKNFVLDIPTSLSPANYNSVIVWCETFEQFITAAQYQPPPETR